MLNVRRAKKNYKFQSVQQVNQGIQSSDVVRTIFNSKKTVSIDYRFPRLPWVFFGQFMLKIESLSSENSCKCTSTIRKHVFICLDNLNKKCFPRRKKEPCVYNDTIDKNSEYHAE